MAKKKIFISYDYTNDKTYKNLLLAWDKNSDFDFGFYDMSVDVSVDSNDAAAIKRVISARIGDSTYFLCLVGKYTSKSKWVAWEIAKAVELKKRLIGVKIDKDNPTPDGLYGVGAKWALSFNFEAIKNAVDEA
jgi:hypothetical protein